MSVLVAYVDGGSLGNPGPSGIGVVIDRPNAYADESIIRIAKVRFEETGEKGEVKMTYDRERSRYLTLDKSETEQEGMEI